MLQDDRALLGRLKEQGVEFVVIGGVCGVLHGVPLVTFDLDICCSFSAENLHRLESAVKDLHPRHRLVANPLPFQLTDELCARLKNLYLQTDLGKLDCLSEVAGIGDYQEALKNSMPCGTDRGVRMLNIDALIASKLAAGRERDLAAIRLLRAIQERLGPNQPKANM
jgi:hypothetical protein